MVRVCLAYFSGIAAIVWPVDHSMASHIFAQFPFTKHIMLLEEDPYHDMETTRLPRCHWMQLLEQEEIQREVQEPISEFLVKQPPSYAVFKGLYEYRYNYNGQVTPSFVAIVGGFDHAVQLLADLDALSIDKSWLGPALLATACANRKKRTVEILCKKGAYPREQYDTSLLIASSIGDVEIARLLLDFGADINAKSGKALKRACGWEHVDMVELLLRRGADPGIPKETTPDFFSSHEDYTTNICLPKHRKHSDNPSNYIFYQACTEESADICRLFMQYRSEVLDVATQALYIACYSGNPDIVNVLLENGAKHSPGYMEELDAVCERGNRKIIDHRATP